MTYRFGDGVVSFPHYQEQHRRARLLAVQFEEYARSIGCRVFGDEIISGTEEQALLLDAKWKELTK